MLKPLMPPSVLRQMQTDATLGGSQVDVADAGSEGYISSLHALLARRTLIRKPADDAADAADAADTAAAAAAAVDAVVAGDDGANTRDASHPPDGPAQVQDAHARDSAERDAVQDELAQIEAAMRDARQLVVEARLAPPRRSPSVESTPVVPAFDPPQFWGSVQAPMADISDAELARFAGAGGDGNDMDRGDVDGAQGCGGRDALNATDPGATKEESGGAVEAKMQALLKRIEALEAMLQEKAKSDIDAEAEKTHERLERLKHEAEEQVRLARVVTIPAKAPQPEPAPKAPLKSILVVKTAYEYGPPTPCVPCPRPTPNDAGKKEKIVGAAPGTVHAAVAAFEAAVAAARADRNASQPETEEPSNAGGDERAADAKPQDPTPTVIPQPPPMPPAEKRVFIQDANGTQWIPYNNGWISREYLEAMLARRITEDQARRREMMKRAAVVVPRRLVPSNRFDDSQQRAARGEAEDDQIAETAWLYPREEPYSRTRVQLTLSEATRILAQQRSEGSASGPTPRAIVIQRPSSHPPPPPRPSQHDRQGIVQGSLPPGVQLPPIERIIEILQNQTQPRSAAATAPTVPAAAPAPSARAADTAPSKPAAVPAPSTSTLIDDTFETILGERVQAASASTAAHDSVAWLISSMRLGSSGDTTGSLLPHAGDGGNNSGDAAPDVIQVKEQLTPTARTVWRVFRWINFVRALATAGYSLHSAALALQNPYMTHLGANGFWITSIVFVAVDVVAAAIRAFPKTFWFCWDVRTWDPLEKSWTPWALVADHDLIIDILPLLANMVLKIYGYRLSEVIANPSARDSISQSTFTFSDVGNPEHNNFVLMIVYILSVLYTVLFHTGRLWRAVTFTRRAPLLGALVVVKALLLLFDLATNALLLYQVLVFSKLRLLALDRPVQLMLAVIIPSPLVTLTTNTLINLPTHYAMLRMQLSGKSDPETGESGDAVPAWRVLKAATRRTFHPIVVLVFGTYAAFATVALFVLVGTLLGFDPVADIRAGTVPQGVIPTSGFFGSTSGAGGLKSGANILLAMVWLNLVANYLVGVVSALAYWTYALGSGFFLAVFRYYR
ncbi:hypothetical protein HK105_203885 [Polyrhizophydium stewartii]|uniref:Transmembrane protein n=1 Tax=Polyrhizophydium stewartii TaxID=2732419 RepID=A0ABR4NAB2_9FUNG